MKNLKLSFLDSRPFHVIGGQNGSHVFPANFILWLLVFLGPTVRDSRRVEYLDTHLKTPVAVISIHIFQKTVRGLGATAAKLAIELCSVDDAAPRSSSDKYRFGQSSGPWQKRCRRSSPLRPLAPLRPRAPVRPLAGHPLSMGQEV